MADLNVRSLLLLALQCRLITADIFPRQTSATITSSGLVVTSSAALPTSTLQPCCWLVGAFQGVRVNTWYPPVTQYTATVVTTFLRSNGTTRALNSSTIYLAKNDTFSGFGAWGPGASHADLEDVPTTSIPGVPTTLVPDALMTDLSNYAVSEAVFGNATVGTLYNTGITVYSPTAFATFYVAVVTQTLDPTVTSFQPSLCGTPSPVPYVSYSGGAWSIINKTEIMPINYTIEGLWGSNIVDDSWNYPILQALPAAPPNYINGITIGFPSGASSQVAGDSSVQSMYPWITDCFTAGGTGQPTVHVPVTQLTSDSSTYIDDTPSTAALPETTEASSKQPGFTSTTSASASAQSPVLTTATVTASATSVSVQTVQGTTFPETTITATTISASTSGGKVIPATTILATTILASTIPGTTKTIQVSTAAGGLETTQVVTIAGQVYTATEESGAIVINSATVKPGSAAVINGETVSVMGTNIVVASGTSTTTEGIGGAIMSGLGGGGNTATTSRALSNGASKGGVSLILLASAVLVGVALL